MVLLCSSIPPPTPVQMIPSTSSIVFLFYYPSHLPVVRPKYPKVIFPEAFQDDIFRVGEKSFQKISA